MTNASERANGPALPSDRRAFLRGLLTAGSIAAAPVAAIASSLRPTGEIENPDFLALGERLISLCAQRPDAVAAEQAASDRFNAEAPLRPARPIGKYRYVCVDPVRQYSADGGVFAPELPNGRNEITLSRVYRMLREDPPDTPNGRSLRNLIGASSRWERSMCATAERTGLSSAHTDRLAIDAELAEIIPKIFAHQPTSRRGLTIYAHAYIAKVDTDTALFPMRNPEAMALARSAIALSGDEGRTI